MHDIDTTELKLKSTPTGGVEAAHSPYYRRLLSAGYKGFLQGSIGGAALYGAFGLVIGGLLTIPAMVLFPPLGLYALTLIPAAAGVGMLKGASTFGNIGSVAAINAEGSDLAEQRRYLLDRYYDLPEGPEGDREAEAIKKELLKRQTDNDNPPPFFHWKTVAFGVAAGAALAVGLIYFAPMIAAAGGLMGTFGTAITAAFEHSVIASAAATTLGATAGGLAGATIGIDRYYIRKWFDHSEGVVHGSAHQETALEARHQQVERIKEAAKADEQTKLALRDGAHAATPDAALATAAPETKPTTTAPVAHLDKPTHTISAARREGLIEMHRALELA